MQVPDIHGTQHQEKQPKAAPTKGKEIVGELPVQVVILPGTEAQQVTLLKGEDQNYQALVGRIVYNAVRDEKKARALDLDFVCDDSIFSDIEKSLLEQVKVDKDFSLQEFVKGSLTKKERVSFDYPEKAQKNEELLQCACTFVGRLIGTQVADPSSYKKWIGIFDRFDKKHPDQDSFVLRCALLTVSREYGVRLPAWMFFTGEGKPKLHKWKFYENPNNWISSLRPYANLAAKQAVQNAVTKATNSPTKRTVVSMDKNEEEPSVAPTDVKELAAVGTSLQRAAASLAEAIDKCFGAQSSEQQPASTEDAQKAVTARVKLRIYDVVRDWSFQVLSTLCSPLRDDQNRKGPEELIESAVDARKLRLDGLRVALGASGVSGTRKPEYHLFSTNISGSETKEILTVRRGKLVCGPISDTLKEEGIQVSKKHEITIEDDQTYQKRLTEQMHLSVAEILRRASENEAFEKTIKGRSFPLQAGPKTVQELYAMLPKSFQDGISLSDFLEAFKHISLQTREQCLAQIRSDKAFSYLALPLCTALFVHARLTNDPWKGEGRLTKRFAGMRSDPAYVRKAKEIEERAEKILHVLAVANPSIFAKSTKRFLLDSITAIKKADVLKAQTQEECGAFLNRVEGATQALDELIEQLANAEDLYQNLEELLGQRNAPELASFIDRQKRTLKDLETAMDEANLDLSKVDPNNDGQVKDLVEKTKVSAKNVKQKLREIENFNWETNDLIFKEQEENVRQLQTAISHLEVCLPEQTDLLKEGMSVKQRLYDVFSNEITEFFIKDAVEARRVATAYVAKLKSALDRKKPAQVSEPTRTVIPHVTHPDAVETKGSSSSVNPQKVSSDVDVSEKVRTLQQFSSLKTLSTKKSEQALRLLCELEQADALPLFLKNVDAVVALKEYVRKTVRSSGFTSTMADHVKKLRSDNPFLQAIDQGFFERITTNFQRACDYRLSVLKKSMKPGPSLAQDFQRDIAAKCAQCRARYNRFQEVVPGGGNATSSALEKQLFATVQEHQVSLFLFGLHQLCTATRFLESAEGAEGLLGCLSTSGAFLEQARLFSETTKNEELKTEIRKIFDELSATKKSLRRFLAIAWKNEPKKTLKDRVKDVWDRVGGWNLAPLVLGSAMMYFTPVVGLGFVSYWIKRVMSVSAEPVVDRLCSSRLLPKSLQGLVRLSLLMGISFSTGYFMSGIEAGILNSVFGIAHKTGKISCKTGHAVGPSAEPAKTVAEVSQLQVVELGVSQNVTELHWASISDEIGPLWNRTLPLSMPQVVRHLGNVTRTM